MDTSVILARKIRSGRITKLKMLSEMPSVSVKKLSIDKADAKVENHLTCQSLFLCEDRASAKQVLENILQLRECFDCDLRLSHVY